MRSSSDIQHLQILKGRTPLDPFTIVVRRTRKGRKEKLLQLQLGVRQYWKKNQNQQTQIIRQRICWIECSRGAGNLVMFEEALGAL